MLKAYKYRIYPNKEQEKYFSKCFGCVRFIYNKMLNDKIEYYKENNKMLNNTPAQYKKEFVWLKEVNSLALANAQMNLDKAYKNFFRDKSVGFPKFKSKKDRHYSYTTTNQKEASLLKIYKEDQKWPGNLNLLLTNFNCNVDNRAIPEEFALARMQCRQTCMGGGKCKFCYTAVNFSRAIDKAKKDWLKNNA